MNLEIGRLVSWEKENFQSCRNHGTLEEGRPLLVRGDSGWCPSLRYNYLGASERSNHTSHGGSHVPIIVVVRAGSAECRVVDEELSKRSSVPRTKAAKAELCYGMYLVPPISMSGVELART
jgi:hypothetical protein